MSFAIAGDASSRKLGTFLVMSQFQGSVNSSAMFLTAAAQNLLCMKLAAELGVIIASPWITWFKVCELNPDLKPTLTCPEAIARFCVGLDST